MRVLLTGSSGYLGMPLARTLNKNLVDVTGLDIGFFAADTPTAIPTLQKDVRDVTVTDLQSYDVIVHLAGLPGVAESVASHKTIYGVNYRAVIRLASLSKFAGVSRFIYLSGVGVYGNQIRKTVPEQIAPPPATLEDEYHHRVETDVARLADVGFSPTFLRAPAVYGPSDNFRGDGFINRLMFQACTTGAIHLPRESNAWLSALYIQDFVEAVAHAVIADRNEMHCQAFNIGDARANIRLYDLAEQIARIVPDSVIHYTDNAPVLSLNSHGDFSKFTRGQLAWQPRYSLEDGLRELVPFMSKLLQRAPVATLDHYDRAFRLRRLIEQGALSPDLRWQRGQKRQVQGATIS